MSLVRKIASNTFWQIAGKIIIAILGIVSIKFITNYLSRSAYGEYTTIYDYTALFAIVADFGLFTIAVREMARENTKEAVEKIVGNVLSIRAILAVAALGIGSVAAFLIPQYADSHIPGGVLIVSAAIIITLIAGTMSSVLQFYLRMHWASIALTIGKIITVGYILAVILYFFPEDPVGGFPHLLFAWIIGGLVTIVITYAASNRLVHIRFQFDIAFWKEAILKALPYGMALVLGTIYFRMGTIVLSLLEMKEQIGFYGVPMRFLEILQIIPHYFMNSVLPILTVALMHDMTRARRILKNSLNALAGIGLPFFAGGFMLAWPLTAAVSSPDFLSSRDPATGALIAGSDMALKILLVAMVFTYLHVGLNYALVALGRQTEILWINAAAVIVNIVMNIMLAPQYGFIGTSIAAIATETVMLAALIARVRLQIPGVWDFVFLGKTALSTVIMAAVLYFAAPPLNTALQTQSLFILIPLGGLVFVGSMLATRAVSKEIIAMLRKTGEEKSSAGA